MPGTIPSTKGASPQLAREMGFAQVSVSHEVSPLAKLVGRGDTTVVDAYLSPILRRYVEQVAGELGMFEVEDEHRPRLMFMMSSGGLTDAGLFQGKDAILSGPAGGVVGMVETAKLAGFDHVIGFDMGGTSTDVTHYDGDYERAFDTEVAGVRIRAPMMRIHTVAAGGGSILHYGAGRFQVGPDSAGANPGPACYRRGGPLAVTDANVMLGKLQPDHFPAIFGPDQDQPLDRDVVAGKFAALAEEVGTGQSAEEVAEGFVTIAVENMANAIKKISVQRGYDVTRYLLNSFGGAGGQHACLVADALGMEFGPHPSLLRPCCRPMASAFRRSSPRASKRSCSPSPKRRRTRSRPSSPGCPPPSRTNSGARACRSARSTSRPVLHLRYEGTDTPLPVDFSDASLDGARKAFEAAHKAQFGFVYEGKTIVVEAVAVEASDGRDQHRVEEAASDRRRAPRARRGPWTVLRWQVARGRRLPPRWP